eukprot:7247306-Karenia_brevis.AAC.1
MAVAAVGVAVAVADMGKQICSARSCSASACSASGVRPLLFGQRLLGVICSASTVRPAPAWPVAVPSVIGKGNRHTRREA